ncbi:MAG: glucosamine-6-phosphate deaminase [Janthinobacterium lividum]
MTSMLLDPIMADTIAVAPGYLSLCELVADKIAVLVQSKPNAVLGLATGSTPLGVYQQLVHLHQHHGLDFSRVTCFNLDEYFPMTADSSHSYHHFMQENLFQHINCVHWFVPDGRPRSETEIAQDCRDYEARIADAGGIDLQLLGIGRTGHIGFNEPGSSPDSRTRLVTLAAETRLDAASSFGGLAHVPTLAVSMGIGTILEAREIVLMASGAGKAAIVHSAWTSEASVDMPASWVRRHPNAHLCLDKSAASYF